MSSNSIVAADKPQFFRLTDPDALALKVATKQRGETRQALAATIASAWLHGLITDDERETLVSDLPAREPTTETSKQIYRLPTETAVALSVAFAQRRASQQSVIAALSRAWQAGHLTDERLSAWRATLAAHTT